MHGATMKKLHVKSKLDVQTWHNYCSIYTYQLYKLFIRVLSYVARKCRIIVDDKLAGLRKIAAVTNL